MPLWTMIENCPGILLEEIRYIQQGCAEIEFKIRNTRGKKA